MLNVISYRSASGMVRTVPPQEVESGSLHKIAYSPATNLFFVSFKSKPNIVYRYASASQAIQGSAESFIDALETAPSMGNLVSTLFTSKKWLYVSYDLDDAANVDVRRIWNEGGWIGTIYAEKELVVVYPSWNTLWSF